ncbi:MAG: zf-HC2 domain-containing protein [Deltaproteobacteria bacterium]|nr:zf-HC2 domain-containing protein [Deltaproteobacteria bacterium]
MRKEQKIIAKTITCKKVEELISDYLDHELAAELNELIEKHISHCSVCSRLAYDLQLILNSAHELKDVPMPEGVRIRLHQTLAAKLNITFADVPATTAMAKTTLV